MPETEQQEENDDLVEEIVEILQRREVDYTDLDEAVHDIYSKQASDINNGGMEAQVRAILRHLGTRGGIETLNNVIQEATGDDTDLIPYPD